MLEDRRLSAELECKEIALIMSNHTIGILKAQINIQGCLQITNLLHSTSKLNLNSRQYNHFREVEAAAIFERKPNRLNSVLFFFAHSRNRISAPLQCRN